MDIQKKVIIIIINSEYLEDDKKLFRFIKHAH